MGAWGTGVFDNDTAADWSHDLVEDGVPAIRTALRAAATTADIDQRVGATALAAADVVARLCSGGGQSSSYTERIEGWIAESGPAVDPTSLVPEARAAIAAILDQSRSELFELWAETDDLAAWLTTVQDVVNRLGD